jgi:hypothetical protein
MAILINGLALQEAVGQDGLPRVAHGDDGSMHVLYLPTGARIAQSMEASDWLVQRGPLPADPTHAEIAAALAARAAAEQQAATEAAALRQQIIALAQSAVGVRVDQLTAGQVRALFATVLWKTGALNADLTVRPLTQWVDG